ncbi:MAG: PIN domain-containing protein [Micromonosporaceae bacterium]|nr:PIN domain-containing protein [Micromonosporaceae bacterium]
MSSRSFLDTNIFVYAFDTADPRKQAIAQQVLRTTLDAAVSTQVMNEFYVVTTRKLAVPLPAAVAAAVLDEMAKLVCVTVDSSLVLAAVQAGQTWQLSHWDALMVAAAQRAGCQRILTEDLAHGAVYDGVEVTNPFLES